MIPDTWRTGEAAVIGLAASGTAAARLLRRLGLAVYASDAANPEDAALPDGKARALAEAAEALRTLGCTVDLGRHDLDRIARASVAVVSPGVPPAAAPYAAAQDAGVPVISELDLGARCLPHTRLIVVTGTKGKSTTSALIAGILAEAGLGQGVPAGNIGLPLCDVATRESPGAWLAVEASSFQLHDCPALTPAVGVLTNLSPDHLDRYASLEEYYADKTRLFRNAGPASRWVTNGDSRDVVRLASGVPGTHERFSLEVTIADAWYDRSAGWLVLRGMPLLRRSELRLLGDHNVANALAASLAVPTDLDRDLVVRAMRSFRALHHRLEPVREVGGVLWINDSKSTTVASALEAVRSVDRPVVLLIGGKDKGGDFGDLAPALQRARGVVAYGEAGARIARELEGRVGVVREGHDFAQVLARARAMARPGDAVLLSPACSSFDMFANAEQRGERFTQAVEAMR